MVTQDELKKVLEYRQGFLWWIRKVGQRGDINTVATGSVSTGYMKIYVYGKPYAVHRLVFLYHYGYIPNCIEHIDGDKFNNRVENLRESTHEEQFRKRSIWLEGAVILQ